MKRTKLDYTKSLMILMLVLTNLGFTSCSSGNDKFIGTWSPLKTKFGVGQPIPKGERTWVYKIEKADHGNYRLLFLNYDSKDTVKLTYNEKGDFLVGYFRYTNRKLEYSKETDHVIIKPFNGAQNFVPIEFERIK